MAGTIDTAVVLAYINSIVSMESGLDGRNNRQGPGSTSTTLVIVSMESGLDGRNNAVPGGWDARFLRYVSMESGLDGRNNEMLSSVALSLHTVSMESGLDGRNNYHLNFLAVNSDNSLNGVRPRWPEQ